MAGIIGIYGLVVSVLIANDLKQQLPLYTGFIQLGAGLAVGLAGLAAGLVVLCDPLVLTIFFLFLFTSACLTMS
jgi:ATP synthase proteolipid subunit